MTTPLRAWAARSFVVLGGGHLLFSAALLVHQVLMVLDLPSADEMKWGRLVVVFMFIPVVACLGAAHLLDESLPVPKALHTGIKTVRPADLVAGVVFGALLSLVASLVLAAAVKPPLNPWAAAGGGLWAATAVLVIGTCLFGLLQPQR